MASSRLNYNLLSKTGLTNFINGGYGHRQTRKWAFNDTFGRVICLIIGHTKTFVWDGDGKTYCIRCLKPTTDLKVDSSGEGK
jgi:hypothetical protein